MTCFAQSDQFVQEIRFTSHDRHAIVIVVCCVMNFQRIVFAADPAAVAVSNSHATTHLLPFFGLQLPHIITPPSRTVLKPAHTSRSCRYPALREMPAYLFQDWRIDSARPTTESYPPGKVGICCQSMRSKGNSRTEPYASWIIPGGLLPCRHA